MIARCVSAQTIARTTGSATMPRVTAIRDGVGRTVLSARVRTSARITGSASRAGANAVLVGRVTTARSGRARAIAVATESASTMDVFAAAVILDSIVAWLHAHWTATAGELALAATATVHLAGAAKTARSGLVRTNAHIMAFALTAHAAALRALQAAIALRRFVPVL